MNGFGASLAQIFSLEGAAWTATGIIALFVARLWSGAPAMFAQWVAYRKVRAEEKSADWKRLRDEIIRLDETSRRHAIAEEECRAELLNVKERLAVLEGFELGKGKARQDAAGIVAVERLEADKKADK